MLLAFHGRERKTIELHVLQDHRLNVNFGAHTNIWLSVLVRGLVSLGESSIVCTCMNLQRE